MISDNFYQNEIIKKGIAIGVGAFGAALLVSVLNNAAKSTSRSQNQRTSSRRDGFIGGGTNYQLKCSQCGAIAETGGICNSCYSDRVFQENVRIEQDHLDYVRQQQDIEYQNLQDFNNYQDFY